MDDKIIIKTVENYNVSHNSFLSENILCKFQH